MHCELVVPDLFHPASAGRAQSLELLLARARRSRLDPVSLEAWLAQVLELEEAPLPAGALTLLAGGRQPAGEEHWLRADPVHLQLMRDRLALVPPEALALTMAEAESLCAALNRHFAGEAELVAIAPGAWCIRLQQPLPAEGGPPLASAGHPLQVPTTEEGMRLQRFLNEAQMLFHADPVNEAREARGERTVSSLWLWGAGRLPEAPPARWQGVLADEPDAIGIAKLGGARHGPVPGTASEWLDRAPADGRHLVLLDALRVPAAFEDAAAFAERLHALEAHWFAPLLAALRAGRIGMLSLHVPEAGLSFEAIRGDLRRIWRRPKPLERYAP